MRRPSYILWLSLLLIAGGARGEIELISASVLGLDGDAVRAIAIQRDGTIVLGANLDEDTPLKTRDGRGRACVLRLSPDGRSLLSLLRFRGEVTDLAVDGQDHIYVALGEEGAVKLTPDSLKDVWKRREPCRRLDAAGDGVCALLGGDGVTILDARGKETGRAPGRDHTEDVCVAAAQKMAIYCGFRNARAHDGNRTEPVQIAYLRAVSLGGAPVWTDYDWSTDNTSDRFLNAPENNMADTRAYRCAIGADGLLYVAYEAAGGNHIFRYAPRDIRRRFPLVGGDKYHEFYNSAAEHKTVFGQYDPATGDARAIQQFCARLDSNGKANAVRIEAGGIAADATGRAVLGGRSAYGLPINWEPPGAGDYRGGAFVLAMGPGLSGRELCTRLIGEGDTHAVAAATVNGKRLIVWAGGGVPVTMPEKEPVQPKLQGGFGAKLGFVAVAGEAGLDRMLKQARPVKTAATATAQTRGARAPIPGAVEHVDGVLRRKLGLLSRENRLPPTPLFLSFTRARVALTDAAADGALVFETEGAGGAQRAEWPFDRLSLRDRAVLAQLVTRAEPGNSGAHGVAAFYLEAAGDTWGADQQYRKAGEKTAGEIGKLFATETTQGGATP